MSQCLRSMALALPRNEKDSDTIKAFFVTSFKVNYHILRDLFSAGGVDINDESIAAILADTGGRFLRKPVEIYEW